MSKLSSKPVLIPKGVTISYANGLVTAQGPKGKHVLTVPDPFVCHTEPNQAWISCSGEETRANRMLHGLYRAQLNNLMTGVSVGFQKKLQLIGVGYRVAIQGNRMEFQLGFSHPIYIDIPSDVQVSVEKNTLLTISGVDAQRVGALAAEIRLKKKPEPYKGKGIRYEGEFVRKKAGKAAKKKA